MKFSLIIILLSFPFFILSQEIKIDINEASLEDLTRIVHIGEARAKSIIELRPFSSLDDLIRVVGIGEKSVENIIEEGLAWVSPEFAKEEKKEERENLTRIDINNASVEELTKIVHIGEARAKSIIELRPFSSLGDLIRVVGIGEKTLRDIRGEGLAWAEEVEEEIERNSYKKASVEDVSTNPFFPAISVSILSALTILFFKKNL